MTPDCPNGTTSARLSLTALEPYLGVVKAYCRFHNRTQSVVHRFRSPELEGLSGQAFPESCHSRFSPEMLQKLDQLHTWREVLIRDQATRDAVVTDTGGQLLVVNWRESLFDGACSPITNGFLDDDCMPGWDTWVRVVSLDESHLNHGLVCWIPCELVRDVNDAMLIDPAKCMSWLRPDTRGTLHIVGWGKPR
jgi:hypothetical protein